MQSSCQENHQTPQPDPELDQNMNPGTTETQQNPDIPQQESSMPRPPSQEESPYGKPACLVFAPFVEKTLKIQFNSRTFMALACYNERHNLIISCFTDYTVQFFNADTLSNLRDKALKFPAYVTQMSFCSKTDMFLFTCSNGSIYVYDFSKNVLTKHLKNEDPDVLAAEFIDPENYVFLFYEKKRLYIGNLHYGVDFGICSSFTLGNRSPASLHFLFKSGVLLVGFENGEILSVRTSRLNTTPNISILGSVCGSEQGKSIKVITSAVISGKEYIMTGGLDKTMRIWHFVKGKMRLLRVVKTEDIVAKIVYLEKYQMIVATFRKSDVKFWRFVSGKLELELFVGNEQYGEIFLMKEKNTLGTLNPSNNLLKLIQLHPGDDETRE